MSSVEVSLIVASGTAAVATMTALLTLLVFRRERKRESAAVEMARLLDHQLALQKDAGHYERDEVSRRIYWELERSLARFKDDQETLHMELGYLIGDLRELQDSIGRGSEVSSVDSNQGQFPLPIVSRNGASGALVSEISHSLKTPLAQIKAEAINLAVADQDRRHIYDRISASVDLCNAFLLSYRDLVQLGSDGTTLSFDSLESTLGTIFDIYRLRSNDGLALAMDVPEFIDGYSNVYIASILAPLLENAVEASPVGGRIEVRYMIEDESVVLRINNQCSNSVLGEDSFTPGASSKAGHEGMGLPTVRRLVETHRGASIEWESKDQNVAITVRLPGRFD